MKKDEPEEEEAPAVEEETKKKPKKEEKKEPERVPTEHEWKCSSCGKINQNYVGTCGCGAPKPHEKQYIWSEVHPELLKKDEPEEAETPAVEAVSKKKTKKEVKKEEKEPERVPTENEWKCPKCGKINQNYVGTCGCGEGKP